MATRARRDARPSAFWFVVALALAAGVFFRFYEIDRKLFWQDEAFTALRVSGHSERDWRTVDPRGTVHTATLMHRREPGLVHGMAPYPIVDVELTSGHRMVMTTVQPTETAPPIGTAVRIGFRRLGDVVLPAIDTLEDQ